MNINYALRNKDQKDALFFLNLLATELFFLILAHPVFKM